MSESTDITDYHSVNESFLPSSSPQRSNKDVYTTAAEEESQRKGSSSEIANADLSDEIEIIEVEEFPSGDVHPETSRVLEPKELKEEPSTDTLKSNSGPYLKEAEQPEEYKNQEMTESEKPLLVEPKEKEIQVSIPQTNSKETTPSPEKGREKASTISPSQKRKEEFFNDDFFVLAAPSKKKKKSKKHKKTKALDIETLFPQISVKKDVSDTTETETPKETKSPERLETESPKQSPMLSESKSPIRRHGSITPPPVIDKSAFTTSANDDLSLKLQTLLNNIDLDDDFFNDEIEEFRPSNLVDSNGYSFDDEHEKKRQYILRIISKIPGMSGMPLDLSLDFATKGSKNFSRIFESSLLHFKTKFLSEPTFQPECYTAEQTAFIWIEGRMEIRPFYKPSTLRISPPNTVDYEDSIPPTLVTILLIPKMHTKDYMKIYPEFSKSSLSLDDSELSKEIDKLEQREKHSIEDDSDSLFDEDEVIENNNPDVVSAEVQSADNYFVIGLKGSDNKRVEVQVSPDTKIEKLLEYYIKVKKLENIDLNKVRLIFDDEPLDLNGLVGDTELEEDFEVQIAL